MDFKQITVVVQGPILGDPWAMPEQRLTARILRRTREVLPGATIVLSTWSGANVTGLDFDRLVESPDPGSQPLRMTGERVVAHNNVNRQIVSTRAGLAAVMTPFALKMRSDVYLHDAKFTTHFGRFSKPDPELTFVRDRILSSALHSRTGHNRRGYKPYLFHPNDWFMFGRTEDLRDVWDLPLQTDAEAIWFASHPKDPGKTDFSGHVSRWVAETYVWSQFLKKHVAFAYDSYLDHSDSLCALSERSIAANLVLLDFHQLKFSSLKYPDADWLTGWANFRGRFTHRDWLQLYRRYADPDVRVPVVDWAPLAFVGRFLINALRRSVKNMKRGLVGGGRRWLGVD